MKLVAFVGNDKENWGQITALINRMERDDIIIVQNKDVEGFPMTSKCKLISIDTSKPLAELKHLLIEKIKPILSGDFEVALSLASGNGKEHMALIAALLNVPVGVKIAVYTKEGVQFIT